MNAKGSWGEHEAGKDDAALPLDSLHAHSHRHSIVLSLIGVDASLPALSVRFWILRPAVKDTSYVKGFPHPSTFLHRCCHIYVRQCFSVHHTLLEQACGCSEAHQGEAWADLPIGCAA